MGAKVLIDGAQAVAHLDLDLRALDADFYVFSGHKLYGPTGIGVLYGKYDLLTAMPPWQGGGEMIDRVSFEGTTFQAPPFRFEAGTPHIAGAVGLGAAIEWLAELDQDALRPTSMLCSQSLMPCSALFRGGCNRVRAEALRRPSPFSSMGPILAMWVPSWTKQGWRRTGHHCCQPLMGRYGVSGTVLRASLGLCTELADTDALMIALTKAKRYCSKYTSK